MLLNTIIHCRLSEFFQNKIFTEGVRSMRSLFLLSTTMFDTNNLQILLTFYILHYFVLFLVDFYPQNSIV